MDGFYRRYRLARRVIVAVIGGTLLLLGLVMLVTPGPGILFVASGLGILALEFYWARLWLERLRRQLSHLGGRSQPDRRD
jgi:uncharacterized protein (TIGR02611 family)